MTNANKNVTKKEIGLLKVICALVAIVLAISCVSSFNLLRLKAVDSAFVDGSTVTITKRFNKDGASDLADMNSVNYNRTSYDIFCLNALHQGPIGEIQIFNSQSGISSSENPRLIEAIYKNNNIISAIVGNGSSTFTADWNMFERSEAGSKKAEKYLGRALYFGSEGRGALNELGSISDDEYYTITQDAIWQISHYGKGWEEGAYTTLQGTNIPQEACRFIHRNPDKTLKLMQIIFDEDNYPAPKVDLAIGTVSDDFKYSVFQCVLLGKINPEISTRVAVLNKTAAYNSKDIIDFDDEDMQIKTEEDEEGTVDLGEEF